MRALKLLYKFFPIIEAWCANKKVIKKKIEPLHLVTELPNDDEDLYMYGYNQLNIQTAKEFLDSSLDKKHSLEKKAKVNVIGVTIGVTLITGLYKLLLDTALMYSFPLYYCSFLLVIAAYCILQMLSAGLSSQKILGDLTIQYEIFPSDTLLPAQEQLNCIAINTQFNIYYNFLRNNLLSASYLSIRLSLYSLLILFVMALIPVRLTYPPTNAINTQLQAVQVENQDLKSKLILLESQQRVLEYMIDKLIQGTPDSEQIQFQ